MDDRGGSGLVKPDLSMSVSACAAPIPGRGAKVSQVSDEVSDTCPQTGTGHRIHNKPGDDLMPHACSTGQRDAGTQGLATPDSQPM
jgi:hypothetical protein